MIDTVLWFVIGAAFLVLIMADGGGGGRGS